MSDEQGIGQTTDSLIQALQGEAIAPRDARVKSMWDLLRQRRLLRRSEWLRNLLRRIWQRGLLARPRPRTTQRLRQLLQQWGILGSADITPLPGYPVVSNTVVVTRGGRSARWWCVRCGRCPYVRCARSRSGITRARSDTQSGDTGDDRRCGRRK